MAHDIHREKAAKIFGVPEEKVTPEQRRYAKTLNYALAYTPSHGLDDVIHATRVAARSSKEASPDEKT